MRRILSTTIVLLALTFGLHGQNDIEVGSCTSITVGKDASTDGSTMTSHTCDSDFRTWLTMEPSITYKKGEM